MEAGCDLKQASMVKLPYAAACHGHEACLRMLKEAGCDLGQPTNAGATPALIAAAQGHDGCLCILKEADCDLGAQMMVSLLHLWQLRKDMRSVCAF